MGPGVECGVCALLFILFLAHIYSMFVVNNEHWIKLQELEERHDVLVNQIPKSRLKREAPSPRKDRKDRPRSLDIIVDPSSAGCQATNQTTVYAVQLFSRTPARCSRVDSPLHLNQNTASITTNHKGLYLVLGQVLFERPDSNTSYAVHMNKRTTPLFKCTVSTYTVGSAVDQVGGSGDRFYQCNLRGIVQLRRGDQLSIKFSGANTAIFCKQSLSFMHIIRL